MRPLAFRLRILIVALVVASGAFTPAYAQWTDVATISSTLGNTPYRLCMGGGRTDIGCPADAPLLDRANNLLTVPTSLRVMGNFYVSGSQAIDGVTFANGGVVATGTVSATNFTGNGSGLTGIDFSNNPIDRIVSGTAAVIAQQGGTVNLTLGGTANAAYFHPTLGFVGPGVSTTGRISGTTGYFNSMRVGQQGTFTNAISPFGSMIDVVGNYPAIGGMEMRNTHAGGNAEFRFLVSDERGAAGTSIAFSMPSSNNSVSLFGTPRNQMASIFVNATSDANGRALALGTLRAHPVIIGVNNAEAMRVASNGQVGIGVSAPTTALQVSGTLRISSAGEACDADRLGAVRFAGGQFQICRNGTSWEFLVAGNSGSVDADRITSGTTSVIAYNNTSVTIATNNVERVVVGTSGGVGIGQQPGIGLALAVSGTTSIVGRLGLLTATGNNVFAGSFAGSSATGTENTALGFATLQNNTGSYNVAVGRYTGQGNTGNNLAALGNGAAQANTGNDVTAMGLNAAQSNNVNSVTALGTNSAQNNTGSLSAFVGNDAGQFNQGTRTVGVGPGAAQRNTAANLTAMGAYAGQFNAGQDSTALGYNAGQFNTGARLTAVGQLAANKNSADDVTAIGYNAVSGVSNTFSNITGLGYDAQPTKSNQIMLGNTAIEEVYSSGAGVFAKFVRPGSAATVALPAAATAGAGAIMYDSTAGVLKYSDGVTWSVFGAGAGGVYADRITSGTTSVVTYNDTSATISTAGLQRVIVGMNGNVGIGTSTPGRTLTVNGVISTTMLNVGENPAVTCTAAEYGTLKVSGGKMFMCRQ
ncbi:MAG: hypothetical protein EON60_07875 [Alphaproteobacteria bacterium]|nr:MAG: hypothetical protein EON60_07875 [Alphaproteobacteria bacterium]